MSNLTDLLPAGAGGKQVDFVASGAIGNGATVALNNDGTVSVVAEGVISTSTGPRTQINSYVESNVIAVYDPVSGKVFVVYNDRTLGYTASVLGTVSGSTITFGTPYVYSQSGTYTIGAAGDPVSGKIALSMYENGHWQIKPVTISGSSISYGTTIDFDTAGNANGACALGYDPVHQVMVVTYRNNNSRMTVKTLDLATNTLGSAYQVDTNNSGNTTHFSQYIPTIQRHVVVYSIDADGSNLYYFMMQVTASSGANITYTTPTSFLSAKNYQFNMAYDEKTGYVVMAYQRVADQYGMCQGFKFNASGITSSTNATLFLSGEKNYTDVVYSPTAQKCLILYTNETDDPNSYALGLTVESLADNTDITFGSVFYSGVGTSYEERNGATGHFATYDASSGKIVVPWQKVPATQSCGAYVITVGYTSTNNTNFIGISDSAISDTATGSVTIKGGISSNVTGLTPNTDYYVQPDGSLSTTTSSVLAGKALSSTSINLDYTT